MKFRSIKVQPHEQQRDTGNMDVSISFELMDGTPLVIHETLIPGRDVILTEFAESVALQRETPAERLRLAAELIGEVLEGLKA